MATTPVSTSVGTPEPEAKISPIGRVVGMFFSPRATFEDIVRRPSWILPTVLIVALSTAGVVALNSHFDWRSYTAQQIEKSPQSANMSGEDKERRIEGGAKFAPIIAYVFGIPAPIVMLLAVALVLWGAYNLMAGAGATFAQSFAIVTHAFVPASVLGTIIFITVLFLKPVGSFDLDNPVATNVAIFLPEDASKWLMALCKNVDLFEIWKLLLIAIGFAAVNPRKLKGGKPYAIAFGTFLVYVVIRVGIAFVTS